MKRFNKVSFDDIKTIQVDSGVLLKEFDVENPVFLQENVICATSGGINPVCAPEYYDFSEDVDNAKTAKETKRIRGWNVSISFTTFTTSLDLIRLALGAADISGKVLSIRQKLQYAKDFKNIWWVGERADGIIVAIKLIRSLSDSGFSLQTNKRGKGQISITLKGHSSFSDKNKIPMEIYVLAESDIPIVPDEPETPTASLYLYGTPSKVKYNGVELPDIEAVWTDKETYPYAFICYHSGDEEYKLYMAKTVSWGSANTLALKNANYYGLTDDNWVFKSAYSTNNIKISYFTDEKWSNFDLLNYSGEGNYFTASEPVKSGNIGLRSGESVTYYDGAVLPTLPVSEYPVAGIIRREYNSVDVTDRYFVSFFEYSHYYDKEQGHVALGNVRTVREFGSEDGVPAAEVYYIEDGTSEWVKSDKNEWQIVTDDVLGIDDPCIWANVDLLKLDDSVYVSASDPIPVGKIVDYNGEIPIYEVI